MKHTIKKVSDDICGTYYLYRGYEIFRDSSVSAGYWGAWTTGYGRNSITSDTRKGVVEAINRKLDNQP